MPGNYPHHSKFLKDAIKSIKDKNDDVKIGVKSTAILFGSKLPLILSLFGTLQSIGLAYAGYLNSQGPGFYIISVFGSSMHMIWQLYTLDPDDIENCIVRFKVRFK